MAKRAAVAPSVTVNWNSPKLNTMEDGCLAYDKIWVARESKVYGFDKLSQNTSNKASVEIDINNPNGAIRLIQPYEGGLLVSADNNDNTKFFQIDIESGNSQAIAFAAGSITWMQYNNGSVYVAGDSGLQRIPPEFEDVDEDYGRIIGQYGQGFLSGTPLLADSRIYFPNRDNSIDVIELPELRKQERISTDGSVQAPMGSNGTILCFASLNNTITAVDTINYKLLWTSKKYTNSVSSQVINDNKYCYVAFENDTNLHVLSLSDGSEVKQIKLKDSLIGNMFIDDGILYATSDDKLYTVNIETGVFEPTNANGNRPKIIEVINDVVYYFDSSSVNAVRLGEVIREFYAESILIQEMDFEGGATEPNKKPVFQTEITVFDEGLAPRSFQDIRVTAYFDRGTFDNEGAPSESPVVPIKSGGNSYLIGQDQSTILKTDANGKIRINTPAIVINKNGAPKESMNSPGLVLWADFMPPNTTIFIRPDAQLHNSLAKISKEDLQSAKGYDNNPIIKEEYRDDATMENVAGMITATAQMVDNSKTSHNNRRRDIAQNFLAPGSDMKILCYCKGKEDMQCPVILQRNYLFDLGSIGTKRSLPGSFNYLDAEATAQWLANNPISGEDSGRKRSIFSDFWEYIKNGAAKFSSILVHAVEDVVKAVIKIGEEIVEVIVDTIEKAALLIQGVFNTIVGAVRKVLEALSFLFDWDRIIVVHNEIATGIKRTYQDLVTKDSVSNKALVTAKDYLANLINTAKKTIDDDLQNLKSSLNKSSNGTQQDSGGKANPAIGGAKDNWMLSKVKDNTVGEDNSGGRKRSVSESLSMPALDLSSLSTDLLNLYNSLENAISEDVMQTINRIRGDWNIDSASEILNALLSTFIDIIQGAVDIALDLINKLIEGLFNILLKIIPLIMDFAAQEIKIPFVSAFYTWATKTNSNPDGSKLSILDLFSLLTAIPAVLYEKLSGNKLFSAGRKKSVNNKGLGIAAGIMQSIWGGIGAIFSGIALYRTSNSLAYAPIGNNNPLSLFSKVRIGFLVGGGIIVRGLLLWYIIETQSEPNLWVAVSMWFLPTLSIILDTVYVGKFKDVKEFNMASIITNIILGSLTIILLAILAPLSYIVGWVAITFDALVGSALLLRLLYFFGTKMKVAGIIITSSLTTASGIVLAVGAKD